MSRITVSVALWGSCLALSSVALAQQLVPGTQIDTRIRPGIWLQYSGDPLTATAVGIFDSGDPADTFSRDSALALNINAVTPVRAPQPFSDGANFAPAATVLNQGTTAAQSITSGGWLGAALQGGEQNTPAVPGTWLDPQIRAGDPAHLFTNATTLNRSQGLTNNAIRPWYTDYNGSFSENHTGTSFISAANTANNQAALVDPINGSPLPFSYDNTNGGNGRGLGAAGNPLDQRTSSVSYFPNTDSRVPTRGPNDNAGFVHYVELIPIEFSSTLTPAVANVNAGAAAPALPGGVDRRITLQVSNANAPNVRDIVNVDYSGLSPNYVPVTTNGAGVATGAVALIANTIYDVRGGNVATGAQPVALGGLENQGGFIRRDGSAQVRVIDAAGNNAANFNGGNPLTVQLPSQAPRTFAVINGTQFLWDTGAPTTAVPPAMFAAGTPTANPNINLVNLNIPLIGGGNLILNNVQVRNAGTGTPLLGTNVTNRFGQVWDLSPNGTGATPNRGMLTLTGATDPFVQQLTANGIVFSVGTGTSGLSRTGVNQEASFGAAAQLQSGAAAPVGATATPGEHISSIFRTHLTGSNATYVDEAALGVTRVTTEIDSVSLGADPIAAKSRLGWSVSLSSAASGPTAAGQQADRSQIAADIFATNPEQVTTSRANYGPNFLLINQEVMGLGPNVGPNVNASANTENLRDFDTFTNLALPANTAGGGPISNLDSPITAINDAGTAARPRIGTDRYGNNFDTYFSITGVVNGSHIFRNNFTDLFASSLDLGLSPTDDVDALALYRPSVSPGVRGAAAVQVGTGLSPDLVINNANGLFTFDPNTGNNFQGIGAFGGGVFTDLAIFSLAPGSPSLAALGLSAADLFVTDFDGTFTFYTSAESLGLLSSDNIDGLDTLIPEPSSLCLLMLGLFTLGSRRRQRRTCK